MKRLLVHLFVFAACGVVCSGQTNPPCSPATLFSVPTTQLRLAAPQTEQSKPDSTPSNEESRDSRLNSAETSLPKTSTNSAGAFEIVESEIDPRAYDPNTFGSLLESGLIVRAPAVTESRVVRFIEDGFRPDVIPIGKVKVSCSVITAIKRKNPLCLLNPYVFILTW
jgi:hypothetical protein